MISLDFLKQMPVFKDFTDDQLAEIKACASEEEFKRGDCLFMKGKDSTHLWIVVEGHINLDLEVSGKGVSKKQDMLSFASKTDVFGWTCFVAPYQYRLSGYCMTSRCHVIKIEKHCLTKIFQKDPQLGYKIMSYLVWAIGTHFHEFQDEYVRIMGHNIMDGW